MYKTKHGKNILAIFDGCSNCFSMFVCVQLGFIDCLNGKPFVEGKYTETNDIDIIDAKKEKIQLQFYVSYPYRLSFSITVFKKKR